MKLTVIIVLNATNMQQHNTGENRKYSINALLIHVFTIWFRHSTRSGSVQVVIRAHLAFCRCDHLFGLFCAKLWWVKLNLNCFTFVGLCFIGFSFIRSSRCVQFILCYSEIFGLRLAHRQKMLSVAPVFFSTRLSDIRARFSTYLAYNSNLVMSSLCL